MTEVTETTAPSLDEVQRNAVEQAADLMRQVREVDASVIRAELLELDRLKQAEVSHLAEQVTAAEPAIEAAEAEAQRLRDELAACQAELAELARQDTSSLSRRERQEHRLRQAVIGEDIQQLSQEAAAAEHTASELDSALGPLLTAIQQAEAVRADVAAAMGDPFAHPLGQAGLGYMMHSLLHGGNLAVLLSGDRLHPEFPPAIDLLIHCLRTTGVGADIERRVEAHFADQASPVKHTSDGVAYVPHGLTREEALLMANRTATRQQADPVPSGAEASAWMRDGTGALITPGLAGSPRPGAA